MDLSDSDDEDANPDNDGNKRAKNPAMFRRFLFKEAPFTPPRIHIVREAFMNRLGVSTADEPTLLEHFIDRAALTPYEQVLREDCPLPPRCRVLFNAALHWLGQSGRRERPTLLFDAADIDALSPAASSAAAAVVVCSIDPNIEARRVYAERLGHVPIAATTMSGPSVNDEQLMRNDALRVSPNELADRLAALNLNTEQRSHLSALDKAVPGGSRIAYVALQATDRCALDQLLLDAENSSIDELTRWRLTTVAARSYHLSLRVVGFVRLDFVRLCATTILRVRGRSYYLLGNDALARTPASALVPPGVLLPFSGSRLRDQWPTQSSDNVLQGGAPDESAAVVPNEGAAASTTTVPTQSQATRAPSLIVEHYRAPHLLDMLRTVLHMDTADEDRVDIEELEMSANHRLRVLGTMADLALADPDATMEQLALSNKVTVEDRDIAAQYPRGYLAPRCVSYDDAPGLRSVATPTAYAALGLGMLCVAVRCDRQLLDWLQYTEALLGARRMTRAEIGEHLDGIVEFVRHTEEPDPLGEPLVAKLVAELRAKMRRHRVDRVMEKIAADAPPPPAEQAGEPRQAPEADLIDFGDDFQL